MVDNHPFYSRKELGEAINTNFLGPSIVKQKPSEWLHSYLDSMRDTDFMIAHGGPNEYEMRTRSNGLHSDFLYLDEENLVEGTTIAVFAEEYIQDQELYLHLEELGADVIVPEEQPESTFEDLEFVEDHTSPNDRVRTFTSGYHGHKARKTAEWIIGDRDVEVFALPTDNDNIFNQMIQNFDTYTRQFLNSKF